MFQKIANHATNQSMKLKRTLFLFALSLAFGYLIHLANFWYLDHWLIDFKFRSTPNTRLSDSVKLIGVDSTSISKFNGKLDLSDLTKLLNRLKLSEPITTVFMFDISKLPSSANDNADFIESAKKLREVLVGLDIAPLKNELQNYQYKNELTNIPVYPAPYTVDTTTWGEDDVARRAFIWDEGRQSLFPYLANKITRRNWSEYRGQFDQYGSSQLHVDFRKPGTFKIYSMIDVIDGHVPLETFKDKIVLVGNITTQIEDNLKTPFSRNRYDTSMLEVKANYIETLISDT
ncbi:MAG: CHASE2 domain-containing protein, partial [Bdellovibrionales bacterium]|nr:CHASE2 domain-containing protein [Bdellovibrionales bacterium]